MADRFIPPVLTALDDNGDPLSGAKLYFYESGTTTAKNTYSNMGLTTANSNPVVADSAGRFGDIFLSSGTYKVILKTSADATVWTRDPTPGSSAEGQEWLALGHTPNYSSSTQFTISGDVTSSYHVNRRIKATDATTLYGTITATAYSDPNTTVTVSLDSGSLSSSLSAISVGLISATPRSLPAAFAIDMDGTEIILDGDGDTSITADADDVIDFRIGGGDAVLFGHGTGNTGAYVHVDPTAFTASAGTSIGILRIGNTNAATVPSGTTAIAAGLYLEIPNWTATGTITDSATLYVEGAATEATTDYAVWVDAGDTRLDGDLDVAASATSIKILDNSATALVIKEASTAYMSFITTNSGEKVEMGKALDMNGQELILDADADTSIHSDSDDQIDIKIAGADDFQFTANTFTALSGSTISIASGATIANSGTATGFGVTLANDGDNRVVTGTGSGLNGEANLSFDGTTLAITGRYTASAQPLFLATGTANSNCTGNGTAVTVGFGTEVYDLASNYDGTDTLTAGVAGKYILACEVSFTGVTTAMVTGYISIVTSNRTYKKWVHPSNMEAQSGGNTLSLHLSAIADMDASDTATVQVSLNEGAQVADIVSTAEQTWFSGALLA